MSCFALAPEIEAEAQKIRESWSIAERKYRQWARPLMPTTVVTKEEIQRYRAGRQQFARLEFADLPRPVSLAPFKLPADSPEPPKVKVPPRPKPAPMPGSEIRPIGEVIADIIARLVGNPGGAV